MSKFETDETTKKISHTRKSQEKITVVDKKRQKNPLALQKQPVVKLKRISMASEVIVVEKDENEIETGKKIRSSLKIKSGTAPEIFFS